MRRASATLFAGVALLVVHCGGRTVGETNGSGAGANTGGVNAAGANTGGANAAGANTGGTGNTGSTDCSENPGGITCVDPCTHMTHAPVCYGGTWMCGDPAPGECADAGSDAASDAGCAAVGNAVPVSCQPFPSNTSCDPFGTWSLSYVTSYPGVCDAVDIGTLVVERGADGIARVSFGSTRSATLSADGCKLEVTSRDDWTNPSEFGTVTHKLGLAFSGDTGSGQLVYDETGFCSGSGSTPATAKRMAGAGGSGGAGSSDAGP